MTIVAADRHLIESIDRFPSGSSKHSRIEGYGLRQRAEGRGRNEGLVPGEGPAASVGQREAARREEAERKGSGKTE